MRNQSHRGEESTERSTTDKASIVYNPASVYSQSHIAWPLASRHSAFALAVATAAVPSAPTAVATAAIASAWTMVAQDCREMQWCKGMCQGLRYNTHRDSGTHRQKCAGNVTAKAVHVLVMLQFTSAIRLRREVEPASAQFSRKNSRATSGSRRATAAKMPPKSDPQECCSGEVGSVGQAAGRPCSAKESVAASNCGSWAPAIA